MGALLALLAAAGCSEDVATGASASAPTPTGQPPCAYVLKAVDRFAAGPLFPSLMYGDPPRAEGKPFEMGDRPIRIAFFDGYRRSSQQPIQGPDDGSPVYLLVPHDAKIAQLELKAVVAGDDEWRLVVRRPVKLSDVWKMIEEAAPPPKSLEDWWAKLKSKADKDGVALLGPELADGLLRTAGSCRAAVSAATGTQRMGEWGMGAAKALHAELPVCKCAGMDEPGFALAVSVFLVTINPRLEYGWLPIDKNVFYILPPDATVDALAARLASAEPIPPAPPPPPPPPPPRYLRATGH